VVAVSLKKALDIYTPLGMGPFAAVMWIHGGGYLLGSAGAEGIWCQTLAHQLGAVVAAVEYRLAPEHPYPAGLEDCYQALSWMCREADTLRIDRHHVAVAGNSAGGGLTAAVALLARDRGGPAIAFQMPLYPMIDDRNQTPSSRELVDDRIWNGRHNQAAWAQYLGGLVDVPPYAAPSRAQNLAGLPPCYTMVGSCDLFRDETLDWVSRLAQAGVPVECRVVPGGYHAFEFIAPHASVSRDAQSDYVAALGRGIRGTFC
jgi:acetyl esterase/lipase